MLKKITILLGIFLILVSGYAFAEEPVSVLVNGEPIVSDVPAQEIPVYDENGGYLGDRVMVPLRAVGEALNCDVYWNPETEGITLYRKNTVALMWIEKESAFWMNGINLAKHYEMDVPPILIDNRTMVPVRATTELLGAAVDWIEETNTVSITYDLGEWEENEGFAEQVQIYSNLLLEEYDNYRNYFKGTLPATTGKIVLADNREIHFELYPQFAPATVGRFVGCASSGYYDNNVFHRVIENFVAQGGGFTIKDGTITQKNHNYSPILGEFVMNGYFNLLGHQRGTISFARTDDYNGGSTQFFICHQDAPHLDGNYAAFGKVTEGMDIIDEICKAETDENDAPIDPIMVKTIIIDKE